MNRGQLPTKINSYLTVIGEHEMHVCVCVFVHVHVHVCTYIIILIIIMCVYEPISIA